jgi:nucleoside-diphosphate-sugar epimerase
MTTQVFVTGAGGQIGRVLVRALIARGDAVTALVRCEKAAEEVRADGARVVRGSLSDAAALADGLTGAEVVYHLAGGVRGKGNDDADALNRVGTEQLLAAIGASGQRPLLVLASSCAVYGDRSSLWVPEDYPPSPHTEYGKSKVAAEELVRASGLPARIARIAAVYGPGIRFMMADRMKAGRAFLPGEGTNHIPLVHVDDCVAALIRIAGAPAEGCQVYNVAGRSTPMLKEFYAAVHALAGGTPVRFWSTWIPSAFQFSAARANEQLARRINRKPRFTEDNLRLYTASVRLRVDRLEKELGFGWAHPDHAEGLKASFGA